MYSKKFKLFFVLFFLLIVNVFSFGIGFSFSSYSLETYKDRLSEIQSDRTLGSRNNNFLWGSYADSSCSLETYKNRLSEIQGDSSLGSINNNFLW